MEFFGTKDHGEREDEEAERLVRPMPKLKPPRKDRRREEMQTDRDPDTDEDPDLKGGPDLSLNYKNIGGSIGMIRRVVAGFLEAKSNPKYQQRRKEKKRDKRQDSLSQRPKPKQSGPAKYVSVSDAEQGGKTVSVTEQAAKNNPSRYKPVKDEEKKREEKPKAEAPKELEPKAEEPKADAKPDQPKEAPAEPEAPKKRDKFNPEPKAAYEPISDQDARIGGEELQELAKKDPGYKALIDNFKNPANPLQAIAESDPGKPLKAIYPKAEFPPELKTLGDLHRALKIVPVPVAKAQRTKRPEPPKEETKGPPAETKSAPGETKAPPAETKAPSGESSSTPEAPAAGKPKPPKKPKVPEPTPEDEAMAARVRDQWVEKNRHKTPAFREYAKSLPTTDDAGNFFDPKTKKRVPFEKLDKGEQTKLIADFSAQKKQKGLGDKLDGLDPKAKEAISSLADPKSEASKQLAEHKKAGHPVEGIAIEKLLPALKGVKLPSSIKSIADLQEASVGLAERETTKAEAKKKEEDAKKPPAPPKRPEPSRKEVVASMDLLMQSLPKGEAGKFFHLHPVDAKALVESYKKFKDLPDPKDAQSEIAAVTKAGGYTLDSNAVQTMPLKAPVTVKGEDGKPKTTLKSFKDMSDEERAEAMQNHRMSVVAASLSAREQVAIAFQKEGTPPQVSRKIADFALTVGSMDPKERDKKAAEVARNVFTQAGAGYFQSDDAVDERFGSKKPPTEAALLKKKERKEFLSSIEKLDPHTQMVAVAHLQGEDYRAAHQRFLSQSSPDHISPNDSPRKILKKLHDASAMLKEAQKDYPEVVRKALDDPSMVFQTRVRKALRDMSPKKEAYLGKADAQVERDVYEEAKIDYEKDLVAYQAQREAWDKAKGEHETSKSKSGPYRSHVEPFTDPPPLPPAPPLKPFGYEEEANEQEHAEKKKEREELLQGRVASLYSSYGSRNWQMVTTSIRDARRAVRTAIYHGVEPYPKGHEGFAPYPKWNQVHQCDLGAADFTAILASAKDWLKSPVLSKSIEGMVPDARFRAALDLAIARTDEGKYNQAIPAPLYNMMLAKLAAQPANETLLTVHTAKTAVSTEETEGNAMTVKFAKEHANNILGRLDRIAGTIQENHEKWGMDFATAKSLVNEIDKTADEIEKASFGEESLLRRQGEVVAKVLQQDSNESYMSTFNAPSAPHQTDSDEPYMGQFKDDQSQAVATGKAENGRALAP